MDHIILDRYIIYKDKIEYCCINDDNFFVRFKNGTEVLYPSNAEELSEVCRNLRLMKTKFLTFNNGNYAVSIDEIDFLCDVENGTLIKFKNGREKEIDLLPEDNPNFNHDSEPDYDSDDVEIRGF